MIGMNRWIGNVVILILVLGFGYLGQGLIKRGLNQVGEFHIQNIGAIARFFIGCASQKSIWLGIVSVGFGFMLWMGFLSRMELSQALPMLALSYVPWLFVGYYFFNERISVLRVVGVVLITAGVFCVGYSKTAKPQLPAVQQTEQSQGMTHPL